jgi:hypothetical protein
MQGSDIALFGMGTTIDLFHTDGAIPLSKQV